MPVSFTCPCSKKLRVADEMAGKSVRCPGCGAVLRVPSAAAVASGNASPVPGRAEEGVKAAAFPALGFFIGGFAILVGCLWVAGGIALMMYLKTQQGELKPAALVIFAIPGVLWALCGSLLLILRRRFATAFWIFLLLNLGVGVLLCIQPRNMGFTPGDARFFAAIGLALIVSAVLVQLFHGFLMRDLRRQAKSATMR